MSKNNIGGIGYQLDNLANPVGIAGLTLLADGMHSGNNIDFDQHDIKDVHDLNVTGTATIATASVTGTATIATASVTGTATIATASVTGTATMINSTVTGTSIVPVPTANSHAATKVYVDGNITSVASSIANVSNRGHSKWSMLTPTTITSGVDTILSWNVVNYTSGDFTLNTGSGNNVFTCVNAGTYIISVAMSYTTPSYYAYASINGGAGGTWFLLQGTTGVTNFTATFPFFFAVGNTVSIRTLQSGGLGQTTPKNTTLFDQNTVFFAKISNGQ